VARTDPDYFATTVMNYQLGGNFNSVLNMILREEKGFTCGANSGFVGAAYPGTFRAASSVQSAATEESLEIFRDEISNYREGITEEDLAFTKDAMILSNARRFETMGALLGMLNPDQMIYLVVGDAATQMAPLRALGLGNPVQLDVNGNPVR